mgnify:CR=1 FL=1
MRFAMLIYNNFEITNESTDILTYNDIINVYTNLGLCDYYSSFFYKIKEKNLRIIIDNLLKDYYKKSHTINDYTHRNVFVGLKIKDCISKDYGLNGKDYFKKVVDEHIIKSPKVGRMMSLVKIEDLYNIIRSNSFFNTDNIYLTSYLTKSRVISRIRIYDDFYDNYRLQTKDNGKSVGNVIRHYKMR